MAAPQLPYSISTGIQAGGPAEIAAYVRSVREQGFCVVERVIPDAALAAVRESVVASRPALTAAREAAAAAHAAQHGGPLAVPDEVARRWNPSGIPDAARPPMQPPGAV